MATLHLSVPEQGEGGGSLEPRTAIAGSAAASLFFLTAIAIATRPFNFHENSVAYTSSFFVSSIHSLESTIYPSQGLRILASKEIDERKCSVLYVAAKNLCPG